MKNPQIEPDAGAEAIFWEVQPDDKKLRPVYYEHYVRVKIFSEPARDKFSKLPLHARAGAEARTK